MKITRLFFYGALGAFLLNSCSKDDDSPEVPVIEGDYTNGFFVLNEGSQTAGTVTYVSNDLEQVEQEIFAEVNEGEDLGNFVQSMFFTEKFAFIISNGSNLITVVDRYTFELLGKVESGLEVPMYGVAINGKAYVTNLSSFDTTADDYLAVIDIESLEVEKKINTQQPMVTVQEEDGLLYIRNTYYGEGGNVSVFDPSTNQVVRTIDVGAAVNSIAVEQGFLYTLSPAKLQKIDLINDELVTEILFSETSGATNLEVETGNIYYTIGTSVFEVGIGDTEPAETPLISYESNSDDYGVMYGFEVEDDRIYIADGGDFSSNSFVEIYDLNGELIKRVTAGVGPNGIYMNK